MERDCVIFGVDIGHLVLASSVFAILAFALGLVSLIEMAFRYRYIKGWFLAILAILIVMPLLLFGLEIYLGVQARKQIQKAYSGSYNLIVLGKALQAYSEDHEGFLPLAESWCDELLSYDNDLSKDTFRHPYPEGPNLQDVCHFAFNKNLSGAYLPNVSKDTVLVFEADGPWNLNGTGELLQTRRRVHGTIYLITADQTMIRYMYDEKGVRNINGKGISYRGLHW